MQLYQAWIAAYRSQRESLPIIGTKMAIGGVAEAHRLFEHRIEHRR
jgi:hypothetical protein